MGQRIVADEAPVLHPPSRDVLADLLPVRGALDIDGGVGRSGPGVDLREFAVHFLDRHAPHRLRLLPLERVDRRRGGRERLLRLRDPDAVAAHRARVHPHGRLIAEIRKPPPQDPHPFKLAIPCAGLAARSRGLGE